MKDNLNIIINLKKTILYLDKIVVNFPGNERDVNVNIKCHKNVIVKMSQF